MCVAAAVQLVRSDEGVAYESQVGNRDIASDATITFTVGSMDFTFRYLINCLMSCLLDSLASKLSARFVFDNAGFFSRIHHICTMSCSGDF